jgi:phenylalanine-4-hydroxylase
MKPQLPAAVSEPPTLHGLAAGEAGRPHSADWTIPQDWAAYTPAEHATWATLFERQCRLLPGRACDAFLKGLDALPIAPDRIPDFEALSEVLMKATGWQVVAVPGLVPDEVFFDHLAHRRFPSGQFIRRADQLDYLQEPDVFHDVFGHVPMLMNPVMADYMQAYGVGGLRAQRLGMLAELARVYWYTVEFGLVMQPEGLRLYGAGIASSYSESRFCLDDPRRTACASCWSGSCAPATASTTSRSATSCCRTWMNFWRWRGSTSGRCMRRWPGPRPSSPAPCSPATPCCTAARARTIATAARRTDAAPGGAGWQSGRRTEQACGKESVKAPGARKGRARGADRCTGLLGACCWPRPRWPARRPRPHPRPRAPQPRRPRRPRP